LAEEACGRAGSWHCVLPVPAHDLERDGGLIIVSSIARGTPAHTGFPSLQTSCPGTLAEWGPVLQPRDNVGHYDVDFGGGMPRAVKVPRLALLVIHERWGRLIFSCG
jgi:hypothetical protein